MARNIIEELSADYCNELLVGCLFLHKGEAHEFVRANNKRDGSIMIEAVKYVGTPEAVKPSMVAIPAAEFGGWGSFAFPPLGYRQAAAGQVLTYISRQPSVRRGLNKRDLITDPHNVSRTCAMKFGVDLAYFRRGEALIMQVLKPQFTSLGAGLKDVMAGRIPAFAISADFAVAPNKGVDFLEILYRQRQIGTIDENGKISITVAEVTPSWKQVVES